MKTKKINWYKESKLADLSQNPETFATPVVCPKCHKWQTEDEEGNIEWKYYYNMTPEEQASLDRIKSMFQTGFAKHQVIKCPDCEKTGPRQF